MKPGNSTCKDRVICNACNSEMVLIRGIYRCPNEQGFRDIVSDSMIRVRHNQAKRETMKTTKPTIAKILQARIVSLKRDYIRAAGNLLAQEIILYRIHKTTQILKGA